MAGPKKIRITDAEEREVEVIGRLRNLASLVGDWQASVGGKLEARIRVLEGQLTAAVETEKRLEATNRELEARIVEQAMQIACMEGYLDRVSEQDQVEAGVVEVPNPPTVVPRRPNRRYFGASGLSGGQAVSNMGDANQAGEDKPGRRLRFTR